MVKDGGLRLTFTEAHGQDQIAGVLFDETGDGHSFSSWLALLSLLEAATERLARGDLTSRPASQNPIRRYEGDR